jgi:c-di-GMP-binding flagellar brake protein YcgR
VSRAAAPKRRKQRLEPRVGLAVRVSVDVDGATYEGATRNLSIVGMLLAIDAPLAAGDAAVFRLLLPQPFGAIDVSGKVVRRDGSDEEAPVLGVTFSGLSRASIWSLNRYFQGRD